MDLDRDHRANRRLCWSGCQPLSPKNHMGPAFSRAEAAT